MTREARLLTILAVAASWVAPAAPLAAPADPAAAERQYRIARRLAAEGSVEAAAALEKVVALDPSGVLADDALVDHALLLGVAAWPEDLGQISAAAAQQAAPLLNQVPARFPDSDRAGEARYLIALSRLEPLPGQDPSAARVALLEISSRDPGGSWDRRARYTRAWLDGRQGNGRRAHDTYQRLLVDAPSSEEAVRARAGQGRLVLRSGDYGRAASLLQQAIDAGLADPFAPALRELAVQSLLRRTGRLPASGELSPVVAATEIRQLVGMVPLPDGSLLLAGRRAGVLRLGPAGEPAERWELEQPQAIAADARGRTYAAAGESIYRLSAGAPPRKIAGLGDFSPISSLAIDEAGAFWVLDRRGDRLGRVRLAEDQPAQMWRVKGQRLDALAWDGAQVVALDAREQTLLAIDALGGAAPLARSVGERPEAVAADASGRLAVLDVRAGVVNLIAADGSRSDSVSLKDAGIARPGAVAFGLDGSLHVFDGASGAWWRAP